MVFEGSEKKIEVIVNSSVGDLRKMSKSFWSRIVSKCDAEIISEIKTLKPQYIFVATGFPYQEVIIKLLKENGCHGIAIFGSTGQSQLIPIAEKINLLNKGKFPFKSEDLKIQKILKVKHLV